MFKLTLLKGLLISSAVISVATVTTGVAVLNNRVESPKIQPAIMVDAEQTPIPVASVKSSTIKKPAAVQVSDPVIDCKFTNVPSTKMKQSECAKAGECQIGTKWYIYTSQDKCNSDRAAFHSNQNFVPTNNYIYTAETCTYFDHTTNSTKTMNGSTQDCQNLEAYSKNLAETSKGTLQYVQNANTPTSTTPHAQPSAPNINYSGCNLSDQSGCSEKEKQDLRDHGFIVR